MSIKNWQIIPVFRRCCVCHRIMGIKMFPLCQYKLIFKHTDTYCDKCFTYKQMDDLNKMFIKGIEAFKQLQERKTSKKELLCCGSRINGETKIKIGNIKI